MAHRVLVEARRIFIVDAGSSLWHAGSFVAARSLFVVAHGLLSSCGPQAPGHVGSVVCGTRASL